MPSFVRHAPKAITDFAALQGMTRIRDEAIGVILAALANSGLAQETFAIFVTDHRLAVIQLAPCEHTVLAAVGHGIHEERPQEDAQALSQLITQKGA